MITSLVAYLTYESGSQYRIGLEEDTGRVSLYWEDEEVGWQCFTKFSASGEDGALKDTSAIIDKAKRTISAHKLEPSGSVSAVHRE